jgi:hypothetical protein
MSDDTKDPNGEISHEQKIINKAIAYLQLCIDADSTNRSNGIDDLRFSKAGEQWPVETQNSRQQEQRPWLTINKVETFCQQVVNQQRQQRPRIKVHAVDDVADVKIAEIIGGLCRHIEVNSNADTAYDVAFDSAIHIGWGYWRVIHDYTRPDSFDQDIYIKQIENAFTVYFDPTSSEPDGSDQSQCLISEMIRREDFEVQYPGVEIASFDQYGAGDNSMVDWVTQDEVRIAEFYYIKNKLRTLCLMSDRRTIWKDELPAADILSGANLSVVAERESMSPTVHWCKLTATKIIEEQEWPGRWIPVIPVFGNSYILDGKRTRYGLVKHAKDPQVLYNYQRTAEIESIGMAPKAKWLMAAGQDEGFDNEWQQANVSARPILHYNQRDANSEMAPSPERLQPEPPPLGIMESAQAANQDLTSVLGIIDPAQRIGGNLSGKALRGEQMQSDSGTFHYYDNLTRSIAHTGRIILDLIPKIYDQQRVVRIIGEDGKPKQVTVNEQLEPPTPDAIGEILNDVTVGQYDVVMDTGPGYNSKMLEAQDAFGDLLKSPLGEKIADVGADLAVRTIDAPGMDVLADRLAAANPLAQIDEESDIPPAVQMKLKQQDAQIKQLGEALQAAQQEIKLKTGIEQMKDEGQTKRTLITATTKAHDVESRDATKLQANREDNLAWMHDMHTKSQTQLTIAEMKSTVELMLHRLSAMEAEKIAETEEVEID